MIYVVDGLDILAFIILTAFIIAVIVKLMMLFVGKSVCSILGHELEHLDHSTIQQDDGTVSITDVYQCKICGKKIKTKEIAK